jgi:3-isopropylmalate dehydratase
MGLSQFKVTHSILLRRNAGRGVRRPDNTLATVDHNVPYAIHNHDQPFTDYSRFTFLSTDSRKGFKSVKSFIEEPESREQCIALEDNVREFGLTYFGMTDRRQGAFNPETVFGSSG